MNTQNLNSLKLNIFIKCLQKIAYKISFTIYNKQVFLHVNIKLRLLTTVISEIIFKCHNEIINAIFKDWSNIVYFKKKGICHYCVILLF